MRVSLIKNGIIKDLILPNKIAGNYWLTDYDENGNEVNLINIEAQDGEWRLQSNEDVFCLIKEKKVDSILMKEYNFYAIKDSQEQSYMIVYCSPIYDSSFCCYEIKSLTEGITIGSGINNTITYRTELLSPCHARISLNNLEENVSDTKKTNLIIKEQDSKNKVNANKWGVYVNNKKITEKKVLENGDVIFIMGLKIIVSQINGRYVCFVNSPKGLASVQNLEVVNNINMPDEKFTEDEEVEMTMYESKDYFHKKPRFINKIEKLELQVDPPPGKLEEENMPLILTIGPMLTMSMTSLMMGYSSFSNVLNGTQTLSQSITSIVVCVAMLASVCVWPLFTKRYEKKKRAKNENERQTKYNKYIDEKRKIIQNEVQRQQSVLIESFPTTSECENIIKTKNSRLWEKKYGDDDFLKVNLGTGNQDMKIDIHYPEEHFSMVEDNLKDIVNKLGTEPKKLLNVPIELSLKDDNILALIGTRENNAHLFSQLLLQLVALHSFDDLKIAVLTSKKNESDWDYVKVLPHLFSDDKSIRLFATDSDEYKEVCYFLEKEYQSRVVNPNGFEEATDKVESDYTRHYVIITDCYKNIRNIEFIKNILGNKEKSGFSFIILNDKVSTLPNQCQTFINVSEGKGVLFRGFDNNNMEFVFPTNEFSLNECTKILANIPIEMEKSKVEQLPDKVGFLEMFEAGKIEQLNITNRWKKNNPELSLQAPVGYGENGEKIVLDLHEKYHGPHGLIAGMTGSGKSEFIITYILSMAINYHPDEVQFILIDYKGGGLAGAFENQATNMKLPHLVGTITNLDANEIKRSLASVESELKRRQKAFNIAREASGESTIDIYKYQRMYRDGVIKEPVSHLFIICDEFAELKNQEPEFMEQLISTARIGRSLGVHLILATQKPSGVVDPQIWSNTRFRVCLRVQEKSDSAEVIKCPDAAFLKQTGRFYFQVGFNEIFELGQAAWAGGQYIPSEKIRKKSDTAVNFINNVGYSTRIVESRKKVEVGPSQGEELTNLVKYLFELAIEEQISTKPLWLPKIPAEIFIDKLIKKYNYQKEQYYINPVIGEYDVPSMQEQNLLTIPLTKEGNAIIYGMAGSGKENLISTLIYSSMLTYNSSEINYYVLDFGAESLKIFNKSPIVGDILTIEDEEKIDNLFKMLYKLIDERKELLTEYGGDYINYLKNSGKSLSTIVIIINNYEAYSDTYPDSEDELIVLSRDCTKYGIYFILAATTPNGVRFKLKQNFPQNFVLQQTSEDDYISILGNVKKVYPSRIFGRGIIKKEQAYEFQTALIAPIEEIQKTIKAKCEELSVISEVKAKPIPVLPKVVSFDDVREEFGKTDELLIGINKNNLSVTKYNYRKNRINIITGLDITTMYPLVKPTILELLYLKSSVIFINADEYELEEQYHKYIKYYKDNFDEVFQYLKKYAADANDLYVKNNYNKQIFKDQKQLTVLILGIDNFKERLSEENQKEFKAIFEKIENLDFINYIFIDSIDKIKKYEIESWYKSNVNSNTGIWIGNGINEQFTIKVVQKSKDLREEIDDNFCFVVTRGKVELTKFIEKFDITT